MMKNASIKVKVQFVFATLLFVAAVWAIASFIVSRQTSESMQQMVRSSTLLRNQTDTDMEHDAIRGDVLGILAARTEPSLNAPELAQSLKERIAEFRTLYDKTLAYTGSQQVHDSAASTKPDVELYLSSAQQIADATASGQPISPDALVQFNDKFEKLETSLGAVSDAIGRHVAETRAEADGTAREGFYVTLACLLLIATTILLVWRSFTAQILRPIFEIKEAGGAADRAQSHYRHRGCGPEGRAGRTGPCRVRNAGLDFRSDRSAPCTGTGNRAHGRIGARASRGRRPFEPDRHRTQGRLCQPQGRFQSGRGPAFAGSGQRASFHRPDADQRRGNKPVRRRPRPAQRKPGPQPQEYRRCDLGRVRKGSPPLPKR
jgi:CHASE3 domain sensor protein